MGECILTVSSRIPGDDRKLIVRFQNISTGETSDIAASEIGSIDEQTEWELFANLEAGDHS